MHYINKNKKNKKRRECERKIETLETTYLTAAKERTGPYQHVEILQNELKQKRMNFTTMMSTFLDK